MIKILGLFFVGFIVTTLQAAEIEVKTDEYREVALKYHNLYRAEKGLQPLQLDDNLNRLAYEHADKFARENRLGTSGQYSQNLWSYRGAVHPFLQFAQEAVTSWYKRIEPAGGKTVSLVDQDVLYSEKIQIFGFSIASFKDYTVAVAYYQ